MKNTDYIPLGPPPNLTMFEAEILYLRASLFNVFGIPPSMAQDYERATFSNIESAQKEFESKLPKISFKYYNRIPRKLKKRFRKEKRLLLGNLVIGIK